MRFDWSQKSKARYFKKSTGSSQRSRIRRYPDCGQRQVCSREKQGKGVFPAAEKGREHTKVSGGEKEHRRDC
nr:MAG TPA: hypothetical protein [Caudoviricetes sp.]